VATAIKTLGLTKHFGRLVALDEVDLEVPTGIVFGYLGPNGAGKTTTIRLLMGLLRPTAGRAEILGLDSHVDRDELHRRIGYLPGEFVSYGDLTGEQYLRHLAALRGGVHWPDVQLLAERLDFDLDRRLGALSHGNRQKAGLVQAFMHEPDLLILDEPTLGLDPLVQREFLALVREAREAGRTVFLSSHILTEVEEVADVVGILRSGTLLVVEQVESLKAKALRRIDLVFAHDPPVAELQRVGGIRELRTSGTTAHLVIEGSTRDLLAAAAPHGIENVVSYEADLEEIFLSYYNQETE